MSKSTPLIFFGTEDYSGLILSQLIEAGYNIVAVVTKPDHKSGRGQKLAAPKVKQIATEHGIEVWQPNALDDIRDKLTETKCDFAVLVAYGKIIPERILDLFKGSIINVHPSLLPRYRGPSPVEAAILNGDAESGVSIIKLTSEMDAGPIYLQEKMALKGTEDKSYLYDKLFSLGGQLLLDNLDKIISGELQPKQQDEDNVTYSKMIKKDDGKLDFINKTAEELQKEIRAYRGWPKSHAKLGELDVVITEVLTVPSNYTPGLIEVIDDEDVSVLTIWCKEGSLSVESLQPAGKKEMKIREFLAGYKKYLSY